MIKIICFQGDNAVLFSLYTVCFTLHGKKKHCAALVDTVHLTFINLSKTSVAKPESLLGAAFFYGEFI
jgi:hypothetical protein